MKVLFNLELMVWLVDLVVRSSGGYFFLTNVNINTLHASYKRNYTGDRTIIQALID